LLLLQKIDIEESPFSDFIITVSDAFLKKDENALPERRHLVSKRGKCTDSSSSDHSLLQVYSVVDESNVG
jgi:hypothetical protein